MAAPGPPRSTFRRHLVARTMPGFGPGVRLSATGEHLPQVCEVHLVGRFTVSTTVVSARAGVARVAIEQSEVVDRPVAVIGRIRVTDGHVHEIVVRSPIGCVVVRESMATHGPGPCCAGHPVAPAGS